ncbi:MAG: hypothetical protein AB8G17_16905 [Gammaproteobacteria bacterium]
MKNQNKSTRLCVKIAALCLGAAALATPLAASADELADCLASPGVADFFGFTHRIEIFLDNKTWYFAGPELELNFAQKGQPQDVPGHCWSPARDVGSSKHFIGKHHNTGPLAMNGPPRFWSSDAEDHQQLYWVDVLISEWSPRIAQSRMLQGYVHYHELVQKDDGCLHPDKVVWMRHSAVRAFTFDRGPPQTRPDGRPFRPRNVGHQVLPGVDPNFPPNYDIPYIPELLCTPDR